MSTQSLTWVAHFVDDHDALARARDLCLALGMTVLADDGDKIVLETERGDVVEYCTPAADVPPHLIRDRRTVIGYLVDDLAATGTRLSAAGFTALIDPTDAGAVSFQHWAGPGSDVIGIIQANP